MPDARQPSARRMYLQSSARQMHPRPSPGDGLCLSLMDPDNLLLGVPIDSWLPSTPAIWPFTVVNNLISAPRQHRSCAAALPQSRHSGGRPFTRVHPGAPEFGCIFARAPRKKNITQFFWVRVQKCGVGFLHPGAPGCTRVHPSSGAISRGRRGKKNQASFFLVRVQM